MVNAAAARAQARIAAMQALNQERQANSHALAYDEAAFLAVIDEEGIGHNAVLTTLQV